MFPSLSSIGPFTVKTSMTAVLLLVAGHAMSADLSLTGAGSTFAYPMYSKWFDAYRSIDATTQFNYQSIGSGGGIRQVIAGTVDFGGTDGPMNDKQMADFHEKRGGHILHFPMSLGAVLPAYNLPEVTAKLNFTGPALAGIFLGTITKWNDPELKKANPGITLPDSDVVVIHRSDGSGTTYVWVDYLAKVSAAWKTGPGVATSVKWPVGLGGKGNEGVAGLIKQTPGSIGYVELIYAIQNKIPYGKVQNSAGKFIEADLKSTSAAAAGAAKDIPDDFRVSITNPPGDDSYPIASFTWILVPDTIADPAKKAVLVQFLTWSLDKGQDLLEPLSYARVPEAITKRELAALALIK